MLKEKITELIQEAIKEKDSKKVNALKSIKVAFTNFEKEGKTLSDSDEVKILMKMKAQREESIDQFSKNNRSDLAEIEQYELNVINQFIPAQPSDDEIIDYSQKVVNSFKKENGGVSMRDMKTILSLVQEKYSMANGKIVSQVVKSNI